MIRLRHHVFIGWNLQQPVWVRAIQYKVMQLLDSVTGMQVSMMDYVALWRSGCRHNWLVPGLAAAASVCLYKLLLHVYPDRVLIILAFGLCEKSLQTLDNTLGFRLRLRFRHWRWPDQRDIQPFAQCYKTCVTRTDLQPASDV